MPLSRYNARKTELFIRQNGVKVRWESGVRCPCLNDMDSPSISCDLCDGNGYAYPAGTAKVFKGILTGMNLNEQIVAAGLVQSGQMSFTPPAGIRLDDGDRITLLEFPRRESHVIFRGQEDRDKLLHVEPVRIVGVYERRTGPTGEDALFTFPMDSYKLEGRAVVWQDGKEQPAHSGQYTAQYEFRPKYMVYRSDQPRYRGAQGTVMPQVVSLRFLPARGAAR